MNAIYYLLEANGYLLVCYLFYRLVLQKETFYTLNRVYLLTTTLLAFLMPGLQLSGMQHSAGVPVVYGQLPETARSFDLFEAGMMIYLLAVVFLLARLGLRIYRISSLINQSNIRRGKGIKTVEIADKHLSFSFLNYLFIHPGAAQAETIIRHEQVHIRQLHSLDILLFEVIHIINWFNPFIPMMQRDLKALHEFIADEETSRAETSARDYALFLIHNSYGTVAGELGSNMFNQSLLKKRIMKLNQKRSPGWARLKYALVFLLLPTMLCATAMAFTKNYGIIDLMPVVTKTQPVKEPVLQDTIKTRTGKTARQYAVPPPPPPEPPRVKGKAIPPTPKITPPPSKLRVKGEQIAPPPPPVESKAKNEEVPPPPPPEPPVKKNDQVRFPPPKLKVEGKKIAPRDQVRFPPPKVKVEGKKLDQVRFPPPAKKTEKVDDGPAQSKEPEMIKEVPTLNKKTGN